MKSGTLCWVLVCAFLLFPAAAEAQGNGWANKTGAITSIWTSGAANYAFRVTLSAGGVDQLSSCTGDFAYLNVSDDNYQAKVSILDSACQAGKTAHLNYVPDASSFCQLTDISISN